MFAQIGFDSNFKGKYQKKILMHYMAIFTG